MGATYLSVDFSLKLNYNEEHLREGCKLQKLNRNADFMETGNSSAKIVN